MCTFRETERQRGRVWMNAGVGFKIDHLPRSRDIKDNRASGKKGPIVRVFKWKSRSWFHAPPHASNVTARCQSSTRCMLRGAVLHFCSFAFCKKNKSGERIRAALHLMIQHRHPLHHCWWLSLLKYEQPTLKLIIQIINMIYTRHIQQYQNNLESAFHYLGITNQF